jgi:inositol hexakisphosphate/diphosphoinositol-pentakisphosphate kinase
VKLKRPKQLQEILDTARSLLAEIQHRAAGPELEEKQGKLEQLKSVLEMYVSMNSIINYTVINAYTSDSNFNYCI